MCASQLRQFVHWRVEFEVRREEVGGSGVDEAVRLADGDIGYSSYISDFCIGDKNQFIPINLPLGFPTAAILKA